MSSRVREVLGAIGGGSIWTVIDVESGGSVARVLGGLLGGGLLAWLLAVSRRAQPGGKQ